MNIAYLRSRLCVASYTLIVSLAYLLNLQAQTAINPIVPGTGFTGPFKIGADGTAGQVLKTDGAGVLGWVTPSAGVTDHGALTGLGDDDHPQYALRSRVTVFHAMDYGAVGDGVADDTAAINAAITAANAAGGGVVWLPAGTYKVTAAGAVAIQLKNNVTLRGASKGRILFGGNTFSGTVIDGQTITTGFKQIVKAPDNGNNVVVESLTIRGVAAASAPNAAPTAGVTCLAIFSSVKGVRLNDVYVEGGSDGIACSTAQIVIIQNCHAQLCRNRGLTLSGTAATEVHGGIYQNCGLSSNTSDGGIWIGGSSNGIVFVQATVDENAYASVNMAAALDVVFIGGKVYLSKINANGTGPGYGFKLGNGTTDPTRVTIIGTDILPFAGDRVPTNTILMYGTGHRLIGVTTDPNGGGDIADNSTAAVWLGVNGQSKLEVVATASLPAAAAALNGRILIEDGGAGDRNLIFYAGGERFRIDGAAAF